MKNYSVKILSGIGLSLLMGSTFAGTITDIRVSSLDDNHRLVRIAFSGNPAIPKGFMTDTPPRVALDFSDTDARLAKGNSMTFNDSLLRGVSVASDQKRSRVALDLTGQTQYKVEQKGQEIWVYLAREGAQTNIPPVVLQNDTPKEDARYQVARIDTQKVKVASPSSAPTISGDNVRMDMQFSKNKAGAGVIAFPLPVDHEPPIIRESANKLELTFKNMKIDPSSQRKYDVTSYDTPVKEVEIRQVGNNVKVDVFTGAQWGYDVQDMAASYAINVKPSVNLFESLDAKPAKKSFKGGKVSLDFQDVDVRTILQILAKESGMNIVASDSVQGKMTINLKDVPWDQALDLVMQARDLDMRKEGNIINVAPRRELLDRDRQILQGQKELNELGVLSSRTFQLKYKSVDEFKTMLASVQSATGSGNNNSILSSRGSMMVDGGTNTLIVTDNQNVLDKFEKLVKQLDVAVRQVMIEARIVEADEGFARNLGVKWGGGYTRQTGVNTHGLRTGLNVESSEEGKIPPSINLPAAGATSGIGYFLQRGSNVLALELTAMQNEGKGKIISSPRVLTQDRKEATLEAGTEVAYQEATSSGATAVSFKSATIGLKVTPQITPDGNIIMDLEVKKDTPDWSHSVLGVPPISTKNVRTTAMVQNGATLVVGGLFTEEDTHSNSKVPLLGDIPVIGNLFKSQERVKNRSELLIFITPRIIDDGTSNSLQY